MLQLQDVKVGESIVGCFQRSSPKHLLTELTQVALGEETGGKLHKLSIKDIKHVSAIPSAR
jgi:hypothetical protein